MSREKVEVDFHDEDHVWIKGEQYMSMRCYNHRLAVISSDSNSMCDKIEQLHKENKALRTLLGLPEEGPLGITEEKETFFDDSEEETCEYVLEFDSWDNGHYTTSCDYTIDVEFVFQDYKRCPYCGKKIKRITDAGTKED